MPTSVERDASEGHDARLLRALREIRSMNQKDLESASNVSRATLSRIETGKKLIERKDREELARGLGISVETFRAVSGLIRRIDREADVSPSSHERHDQDWMASSGGESELAEDATEARSVMRRERHRRIAVSAGKAAEETVFQMLELGDLDVHDEY